MDLRSIVACLLALLIPLCIGCPTGDGDDDDSTPVGDDDDSAAGDDDTGDDDTFDPNDQDGDGSSVLDDPPDCDDNDPFVYPDAWELWDYNDNDCDNDIDEEMPLHRQCMLQGDSYDGLSITLGAPGDITGDGLADLLIGTDIRGVLLFEGSETRCEYGDATTSLPAWTDPGAGKGGFGTVLLTGDINNDGVQEIFIGAPLEDVGEAGAGAVYMYDTADGDLYDIDATFTGLDAGENFGLTVAAGGDINADGVGDLLIAGRMLPDTWQIHLFFGSLGGFSGTLTSADADAIVEGEMEEATDTIALGFAPDLNGDSSPELLVGTPDDGALDEGGAYLLLSALVWDDRLLGMADVKFMPEGTEDENLGYQVGPLGDMVGNETLDFYVAAPGASGTGSGTGRVYVYGGGEHSWLGTLTGGDAESSIRLSNSENFGLATVNVGNIDLDGYDDLVVLSTDYEVDGYGWGGLFLVRGKSSGLPEDHGLYERSSHYLAEANDYVGPSLVYVGDMDGDGYGEIALGDYLSGWGDGRAYVLYPPESPLAP
jgi:hypothetical protein